MTITSQVICVDGETVYVMTCQTPDVALKFIQNHDHEGASVTVTVSANDEQAYAVLQGIRK